MHAECPWPRYYFTLSPASRVYDPYEEPLALPRVCGDPTVPEFQAGPLTPHNPFQTDVYCLGSLIRRDFLEASTTAYPRFFARRGEAAAADPVTFGRCSPI